MNKEIKYEICRVCGYVRPVGKGGRCPACGVRDTAFVPFQHKASFNRRTFLKLDVHPVAVHFTISYTAVSAFLFFLMLFTDELLGVSIQGIFDLQITFLPLLIAFGGITGLIDGKIRFRKIKTPYLLRKIVLGCVLLAISIILLLFHIISQGEVTFLLIEGILISVAFIIASYLGWIGAELICPIVPMGKIES
ncbi:MAG: hypothetical protein JSW11_07725 [Candidatus Heimdallarchaeota archaeon]|nr:MAG: hypothetical protein JSW11_07725 [Candidatus Heimdallarchaeota archaeon]